MNLSDPVFVPRPFDLAGLVTRQGFARKQDAARFLDATVSALTAMMLSGELQRSGRDGGDAVHTAGRLVSGMRPGMRLRLLGACLRG